MQNTFEVTYTLNIRGRGFVVCGKVTSGIFKVNDRIQILRNGRIITAGHIAAIEHVNFGSRNSDRSDNIAFLLKNFGNIDILPGDVVCTVEN